MSEYQTVVRGDGSTVQLVAARRSSIPPSTHSRVASSFSSSTNTLRLKAWIVRSIMLATSAFALLDLVLLATSTHH